MSVQPKIIEVATQNSACVIREAPFLKPLYGLPPYQ